MKDLTKLSYIILPGRCPAGASFSSIHHRAYLFWKEFWNEVFEDSGHKVKADDFMRQDFIPVVLDGERIVALHLYTVFPVESVVSREHSYFETYPPQFFEYLKAQKARAVMSIEYLTVNPLYRKKDLGLSLGETLIGCSLNFLEPLNIDAAIAPTRNDRGVNKMCYNFGFDCFEKGRQYHNFEIDLVAGFYSRVIKNPDEKINALIHHFWNNRIDYTSRVSNNLQTKKVA